LMNADGTHAVKINQPGMAFSWSLDGQKIALFIGQGESWHLYRMDQDGSGLKKLTP
jgi:Tol biopolymer transport system component